MDEKEYGTYGPAVDAETSFTNPIYNVESTDMVPSKEFSFYISKVMDRIGYSYEMIKQRQQLHAQFCSNLNNQSNISDIQLITGSKAEGTSLYYENDVDLMYVLAEIVCADNLQTFNDERNITLFQTEMEETSPGYTRLKLTRFDGTTHKEQIRSLLLEDDNCSYYLSSDSCVDSLTKIFQPVQFTRVSTGPRSGPSSPLSQGPSNFDQVIAFRCICPKIIEQWVSRPRRKGWPSPESVHEISQLDGYVVPVGFKGSPNMDREWRICFTHAELHLMKKLNDAQIKVYILLKQLSKSVLKKVCEKMTSYVMKNIVFWMCETKWDDLFSQESIMNRLMDCIQYLRKCVQENIVRSYMIPDRNLLGVGLDEQERNQLVSLLDDLIKERGGMFLRCDKIRDAMFVMYRTPNSLREKSKAQDKVEENLLMMNLINSEIWRPGMPMAQVYFLLQMNEDFQSLKSEMCHLIQYVERMRKQEESGEVKDNNAALNMALHQLLS